MTENKSAVVSVRLPRELHDRMVAAKGLYNWAAIMREAIENALSREDELRRLEAKMAALQAEHRKIIAVLEGERS